MSVCFPVRGDKASGYIAQLHEARCNGQWQAVPEFARKVEKHAPSRTCLALAARVGALINTQPGVEAYNSADREFGASLSATLREKQTYSGDFVDGTVCLAAIFFTLGNPQAALRQLEVPMHTLAPPSQGTGQEAWATVCVIHGTLIRGLSFEVRGDLDGATSTYQSIISYLSHVVSLPSQCLELRRWTEELLLHMCLFFSATTSAKWTQSGDAMAAFHLLSKFSDGQSGQLRRSSATYTNSSTRKVWMVYYVTLSRIVREDLVHHPSPLRRDHESLEHKGLLKDDDFFASRVRQRGELQHVEMKYESLLLQETQFPKANETNEEVKSWVELVVGNWRTLCGASWTDEELGPGGKVGVGRSTLAILYRAAEKTFQSTQIMRHLFTIHAFLAEFDLAFRAFDLYVETMTKGKARADKSGSAGLDLDSNETALRLAADAIRLSCRYGSQEAPERALGIGITMQHWIEKGSGGSIEQGNTTSSNSQNLDSPGPITSNLSPEILTMAYLRIGVSQANLARVTYDPRLRGAMQSRAMESLRRSLQQGLPDAECTENLYVMGLVLAEMRDIAGAIEMVKRALRSPPEATASANSNGDTVHDRARADPHHTDDESFVKEKRLLPVWHLLGLLLSAREEFDMAGNSCEAAFEQFSDPVSLFGDSNKSRQSREVAPHNLSSNNEKNVTPPARGAVDDMEYIDKQTILEIKMTQLALLEVAEGPEIAVNASNELLGLYARLFGEIDLAHSEHSYPNPAKMPPKSSNGTVRSILGHPKAGRKGLEKDHWPTGIALNTEPALTYSPPTTITGTGNPSIQVTNENGAASALHGHHHHFRRHRTQENGNTVSRIGSVRKKYLSSIRKHHDEEDGRPNDNEKQASEPAISRTVPVSNQISIKDELFQPESMSNGNSRPASARQSREQLSHDISREQQLPISYNNQPLSKKDRRPPAVHSQQKDLSPAPRFQHLQERRQRASLLIKIWLFVARLYTGASMCEDAHEAIEEARRLIQGLELEVSYEDSSVKNFQAEGWGGGKSVEELWADIYAERGNLFQSESLPHDALWNFEQALSHLPDHLQATIGLSSILLDIYCRVIPSEKLEYPTDVALKQAPPTIRHISSAAPKPGSSQFLGSAPDPPRTADLDPLELYRLARRDRACGLLTSLTKLGSGWDCSEAWFVLARAYEESGQIDKAKEALWWTVELEDTKPVRHWRNVSPGGYVLR